MDLTTIFHHPAQVAEIIVIWTLVSCAISALPAPHIGSGAFYTWLYTFLNMVLGSLKQAFMKRTLESTTIKPQSEVVANALPVEENK